MTGDRHKPRKGDRHKPRTGDRHKNRKRVLRVARVPERPAFRAWDGEAIDGRYVLLRSTDARLFDAQGIGTERALTWLIEQSDKRINVGFVSTYDVNMLLGELKSREAIRLWTYGILDWRGFRIRYRNRKEFSVSRGKATFRLWDTFGFFQSNFVNAVRDWLDIDLSEIERMKAQRPEFTIDRISEIETYCRRECELLELLMTQLRDAADHAGVKLARWDGAGAIAAQLLRAHDVKRYTRENPEIETIARATFYGGRIECIRFGHTRSDVFTADIRSAYPHALTQAPCFHCGHWSWHEGWIDAPIALYRVQWDLAPQTIAPFPWRDHEGAVYYPLTGRGWYWSHELHAAREFHETGIDILASVVWHADCEHKPFAWIPELYTLRDQWKRESNSAERVLKLGLNSLYGKCAQRLGHHGRKPTTHNMLWASWCTSLTRARLYRVAKPIESNLVAFATDAVFATTQVPVFESRAIGAWETARHSGATVVQSGVYWLGIGTDTVVEHTRGFRPGDFDRAEILRAWHSGEWALQTQVQRFMGIGTALVLRQGGWRSFRTMPRTLKLEPTGTKRSLLSGAKLSGRGRIRPHLHLIVTRPSDTCEQIERTGPDSVPIAVPWEPGGWNGESWQVQQRADHESMEGFE